MTIDINIKIIFKVTGGSRATTYTLTNAPIWHVRCLDLFNMWMIFTLLNYSVQTILYTNRNAYHRGIRFPFHTNIVAKPLKGFCTSAMVDYWHTGLKTSTISNTFISMSQSFLWLLRAWHVVYSPSSQQWLSVFGSLH